MVVLGKPIIFWGGTWCKKFENHWSRASSSTQTELIQKFYYQNQALLNSIPGQASVFYSVNSGLMFLFAYLQDWTSTGWDEKSETMLKIWDFFPFKPFI